MITITDWSGYEVDDHNDAWKSGAKLRKNPLAFIRIKCHGRAWTEPYRALLEVGGDDAALALGVYVKLLELSGNQTADLRGSVRTRQGEPASQEDISRAVGFPVNVIARAVEILGNAGWISDFPEETPVSENSGNSGKLPESRRIPVIREGNRREENYTATSVAGAPDPPSPRGKEDPDPLADYSTLADFYPKALALIRDEHKTARTPADGSKGEREARMTLARLVRLDGFTESDIVAALTWLFESDHRDATFWRQNVAAVGPLRKMCESGLTKFASIHERWVKATSNGKPKADTPDWVDEEHHFAPGMTDAEVKAMQRQIAEEQAAGAAT